MQDVIKYNIIPIIPWEFLYVNKECRVAALDNLHNIYQEDMYYGEEFWRIVRILHANNKSHNVRCFTVRAFNLKKLDARLDTILGVTWFGESNYDMKKVMSYYRYIKWLDDDTKGVFIDKMHENISVGDFIPICDLMDRAEVVNDKRFIEEIDDMLRDRYYFDDDTWDIHDTNCIKFAIKYFPDMIADYALRCLQQGIPNGSLKCVKAIYEHAKDVVDAATLEELNARYLAQNVN